MSRGCFLARRMAWVRNRSREHFRGIMKHLSCNAPGLLQESLGPFGPEVSQECPSGCLWGPSGPGLWSVQKVSRECPWSVKRCPGHSGDTLGALFRHSGARGPKGPRDTPRDTPGTLRARRARETPVAGRGGYNTCVNGGQDRRTSREVWGTLGNLWILVALTRRL